MIRRRPTYLSAAVALACVLAALPLDSPVEAYSGPVPWVDSDGARGTLALFDASGAQVFGGDDVQDVARYLVASTTGTPSATSATLRVAVPRPESAPSSWCQRAVSANQTFQPPPDGSPGAGTEFFAAVSGVRPFLRLAPELAANVEFTANPAVCPPYTYPGSGPNYTETYANVLELRLSDSTGGTFWRTVIEYNPSSSLDTVDGLAAGEWRQVFPEPTLTATTVSAPTAVPSATVLEHQTPVVLSVSVRAADGTRQNGSVEFYDDIDGRFYSPYTTWDAATGVATVEVTPDDGDHRFYAKFTPLNSRYLTSVSPRLALHVNRVPPALTGVGPRLTGVASPGSTLTCSSGTWDSPRISPYLFSYEWRLTASGSTTVVDRVVGTSASSVDSRVIPQEYYGKGVSCVVTAVNADGGATSAASNELAVFGGPAPEAPVSVAPPTVTGALWIGRESSCSAGTWSQAGLSFTYVWRVSGSASPLFTVVTSDPTAQSAVVPSSALGLGLTCSVTALNPDGLSAVAASPSRVVSKPPAAPTLRTRPTISGSRRVGGIVECTPGAWSQPGLVYAYGWKYQIGTRTVRMGYGRRKMLQANSFNFPISCTVTATNVYGLTSSATATAGPVARGAAPRIRTPALRYRPRLMSAPRLGRTTSVSHGSWVWTPVVSTGIRYSYQWLRYSTVSGGVGVGPLQVVGRTASYKPTASDRGRYLVARVLVSRRGYARGVFATTPTRVP